MGYIRLGDTFPNIFPVSPNISPETITVSGLHTVTNEGTISAGLIGDFTLYAIEAPLKIHSTKAGLGIKIFYDGQFNNCMVTNSAQNIMYLDVAGVSVQTPPMPLDWFYLAAYEINNRLYLSGHANLIWLYEIRGSNSKALAGSANLSDTDVYQYNTDGEKVVIGQLGNLIGKYAYGRFVDVDIIQSTGLSVKCVPESVDYDIESIENIPWGTCVLEISAFGESEQYERFTFTKVEPNDGSMSFPVIFPDIAEFMIEVDKSKITSNAYSFFYDSSGLPDEYKIFTVYLRDGPSNDPYSPGGNSSPAGGGGGFGNDRTSDDLTPLIPNGSAENDLVDAGIFTRYLVNNAQLKEFAKWLFVDNWGEAIWRELTIATFGNIYDSLISVMSYPFAVGQLPGIATVEGNIYLGSLNSGAASSGILAKSFSQIDWGSISITEYWGNFLDYAPHTKIQLFLPWGTGFVDIDPNEVMNGTLQVKTNIELSKGTCVHIVYTGEGAIIGAYNGFCGAQYPITAVDTSGKAIATAISAVAGVTAVGAAAAQAAADGAILSATRGIENARGVAESGVWGRAGRILAEQTGALASAEVKSATYGALKTGAAKTAAVSSLAAARIPASFTRNGSFAPNAAGMLPQKPFIIVTWPDQSIPEQYGSHVGYPSNIYISLGRLRGYTEVGAIHLDGINCTEHEREELMSLLQGGVIL